MPDLTIPTTTRSEYRVQGRSVRAAHWAPNSKSIELVREQELLSVTVGGSCSLLYYGLFFKLLTDQKSAVIAASINMARSDNLLGGFGEGADRTLEQLRHASRSCTCDRADDCKTFRCPLSETCSNCKGTEVDFPSLCISASRCLARVTGCSLPPIWESSFPVGELTQPQATATGYGRCLQASKPVCEMQGLVEREGPPDSVNGTRVLRDLRHLGCLLPHQPWRPRQSHSTRPKHRYQAPHLIAMETTQCASCLVLGRGRSVWATALDRIEAESGSRYRDKASGYRAGTVQVPSAPVRYEYRLCLQTTPGGANACSAIVGEASLPLIPGPSPHSDLPMSPESVAGFSGRGAAQRWIELPPEHC
ncbi:hypothetical protein LIA77_01746 [Sarocladium implicatum]|nr:hypothetical protein LIA77_01746 [Sarocladium implicatum]